MFVMPEQKMIVDLMFKLHSQAPMLAILLLGAGGNDEQSAPSTCAYSLSLILCHTSSTDDLYGVSIAQMADLRSRRLLIIIRGIFLARRKISPKGEENLPGKSSTIWSKTGSFMQALSLRRFASELSAPPPQGLHFPFQFHPFGLKYFQVIFATIKKVQQNY